MAGDFQDYKTPVHVNWCPGCVLPGIRIRANPGVKPIEEIRVLDRVMGLDGRYHQVTEVMSHRHEGPMYRIHARSLGETTLTPEHPVLIARAGDPERGPRGSDLAWERADGIQAGDLLAYPAAAADAGRFGFETDPQGRFALVPVDGIEVYEYRGEVRNLEVEGVHSYVSESATLHNCGNFGILYALQLTLADLEIEPHRLAVFSGIGCSGKASHYVNAYGIHTLHGRVLPYATGAKLANPTLVVIAVGGDGDGVGMGAGHFVNAGRRNVDITYLLHNNGVYGLTKGQASPTLRRGLRTRSLPNPNIYEAVNPLILALAAGYTFIARGYAYDPKGLSRIIRQGIEHRGSSFIDILQPCPTYNNIFTKEWYGGEDRKDPGTGKPTPRIYAVEETGHDPSLPSGLSEADTRGKLGEFMAKALEWGDRIPVGVLLRRENVPTFEERLAERIPFYVDGAPGRRAIAGPGGNPTADLDGLLEELRVI